MVVSTIMVSINNCYWWVIFVGLPYLAHAILSGKINPGIEPIKSFKYSETSIRRTPNEADTLY